jgi:hypothetical protein
MVFIQEKGTEWKLKSTRIEILSLAKGVKFVKFISICISNNLTLENLRSYFK